ncbi:MAG: response regulator [Verrucomicrobiae bacterium]|nr:response regulator [Verrucomicrobiae bacterium]
MNEDIVQILAVDDESMNLLVLDYIFRKSGMEIVGVGSAAEAIQLLQQQEFGAVLSDVNMSPMNGFEMAHRMKGIEQAKSTPIIFLSGLRHDNEYIAKVYECGAVDSLIKPIDGEVLRSKVSVFADLYLQRKKFRRAIREQLEMKDRFLSQVSHELKTPLNSLYQFLQIVESGMAGELNDEQRDYLGIAIRNAASLREMIEDLMEVTRIDHGKLSVRTEALNLESCATSCIRSMRPAAESRRFTMNTDLPGDLPTVWADPKRVRQVLTNLLSNAMKFGGEGKALTLRARISPSEEQMVEISVADNGPGIAPHLVPQVFDRLCQVDQRLDIRRQGLGLGLFICRELVEMQGGQIWVESQLGTGSVFTFTLPVLGGHHDRNVADESSTALIV